MNYVWVVEVKREEWQFFYCLGWWKRADARYWIERQGEPKCYRIRKYVRQEP